MDAERSERIRVLSTWGILFSSSVVFSGPAHGLVAFIVVVTAIIIAVQAIVKVHKLLA